MVERALRGETKIFPLVMRGDAKAALLAVIYHELCPVLGGGTFEPEKARVAEQTVRSLYALGESLAALPNDIQIEPHEIVDAVERLQAMIFNSPFHTDRRERTRLASVREGWLRVLGEFAKGEMAAISQLATKSRAFELRKAESKWALNANANSRGAVIQNAW